MPFLKSLASGFAGAVTLTLIHEITRKVLPSHAPRMDVLGMRALARLLHKAGVEAPEPDRLHHMAMAGDLVSNTLYYSLVAIGSPKRAIIRGFLFGLAAGIGGLVLPGPLGLGKAPSSRTTATESLTIHHYLAGGLAAAIAYRMLSKSRP